jgi:hypothetical protein
MLFYIEGVVSDVIGCILLSGSIGMAVGYFGWETISGIFMSFVYLLYWIAKKI